MVAWVRGVFLRVLGLRDFLFRHTVTGDWLWCTTETITMEGEWNRFHRLFPCNNHVKMSKWWGTDIIHNMCFPTQRQNHRTLYERSPRSVATSWRLHVQTLTNFGGSTKNCHLTTFETSWHAWCKQVHVNILQSVWGFSVLHNGLCLSTSRYGERCCWGTIPQCEKMLSLLATMGV